MDQEHSIEISLLVNSIFFFIEHVFLLKLPNNRGFRLVVFHKDRLLTDEVYQTARGARIAFVKIYSFKAWKEGVKPDWSHFYDPEKKWLKDRTVGLSGKIGDFLADIA